MDRGPTEHRCPGGRCGRAQPFTLDECVKVAAVPLTPNPFPAVEAPPMMRPVVPCRDPGPGHWRRSADGWAFTRGACAVRRVANGAGKSTRFVPLVPRAVEVPRVLLQ